MTVTVLLADDHPIVRHGLRHLLEEEPNIKIVGEAIDGLQAVHLTEKFKPNVLILDIMMPQMTGYQVCEWIRANPATAGIPVIVCTANQERKHLEQAIKAGASDFLCKPVTKKTLEERLLKHLHSEART